MNEEEKKAYQVLKDDIEGHRIVYVDTPEFEENYISKNKILKKLEEIRKQYNNILSSDNVSLEFKNINSHRFDAMSQVLEELLKGI